MNMDNRLIKCLDTGETVVGYEKYLKTRHWFNLRRSIITKDSRCSACGYPGNINLHHRSYKNIGNESKGDFVVLCGKCHDKIHKIKKSVPLSTATDNIVKKVREESIKYHKKRRKDYNRIRQKENKRYHNLLETPMEFYDNYKLLI